jgi:hypothetical protein
MTIANAKSRRATFASPSREANARRPAASCSVRVIATVIVSLRRQDRAIESYYVEPDQEGCEPKLWDQAAAFDDASGWLRLAGADGLSASAAQ